MRLKLSILLVILVACVTVRAQAQSSQAKSSEESGTISGQVVSDNGQPIASASLFIRATNSFNPARGTSSDSEGNFHINNLEPGLYMITASAPTYATEPLPAPVYYRLGDAVRLEMMRGGVITGTVTNSSNDPVIGVRVRAVRIRDAKGQTSKSASFGLQERTTDDRGVYRIYGLLPGTYLISAGGSGGSAGFTSVFNPFENDVPTYAPSATRDNAAEIGVRSGEETTADIRYRGERGYTISGTVKLTNTNGASVTLRAIGNSVPLASAFQMSGARGFAFPGLPDGEYTLRAQEIVSADSSTPQLATSITKRITIKGANVTGIELMTTPMSSISGRIVLEPSKIPECQGKRAPLFAETLVQLQRPEKDAQDEDGIFVGLIGGSASPDANGALSWRNVMPGRYRFEPRFYARYWYLKSITTKTPGAKPQTIDAAANWTTTKSGDQLTGLTITLAEGAASIRGRLALAEGAVAQPGTIVYLVPAEPDKATEVLRFFATDVASDGTFALNNLPPGKYLALTQTNVDAQISTQAKLREPETEAAAARAKLHRAAETKKTEIELKPCQNLADYQLQTPKALANF